ncbi:MAG: hypothetical protein ACKV19_00310 [Verrucomicrobiales bacterium]
MNSFLRRIRLFVTAALLAALPGCVSTLPTDLMAVPGMVQDIASEPTDAYDVIRKVDRTLALIAVVRRYAELTAPQKQRVEQVVTRRYNGMVAKEKKALAPRYAGRKAEVQKRGAARVAEARKKSPAAAAKAESETKKEVEKVDVEWDKAARSSVAKNQGTDFAVPVKNSSGKAVVAFASVKESGVSVSNSAYEVEGTTASLNSNKKISHSGRTYAVLDEKVSL